MINLINGAMSHYNKGKRPPCLSCGSSHILKNASIHNKKQKYLCKDCGRQFVENPTKRFVGSLIRRQYRRKNIIQVEKKWEK